MNITLEEIVFKTFNDLVSVTKSKIGKETVASILGKRVPLTTKLFEDNISDLLYFLVCQRVTTSFSTRLGKVIENLCKELIKYRGGKIIDKPNPFDLKFILNDNEEYWIEIKSIDGQNSSNKQSIADRKKLAEDNGKIFKLCIYNDDKQFDQDYKLNGQQFWDFILGEENSQDKIFSLIKGKGIDLSVKNIIEENFNRLDIEYKSQH